MSKPRLLDLYCCAGGAGMGYSRAGFEVVGVDKDPQPRYPFEFHQADALEFLAKHGHEFDAIHASPPCQRYSESVPMVWRERHPDLIGPTRESLEATGLPFVIENVEGAKGLLREPIVLCGTMFGLPVWRHRCFEVFPRIFPLLPPCDHRPNPLLMTPAGSHSRKNRKTNVASDFAAIGIDWMRAREVSQAIPPAYTEFIGRQLMAETNERTTPQGAARV